MKSFWIFGELISKVVYLISGTKNKVTIHTSVDPAILLEMYPVSGIGGVYNSCK